MTEFGGIENFDDNVDDNIDDNVDDEIDDDDIDDDDIDDDDIDDEDPIEYEEDGKPKDWKENTSRAKQLKNIYKNYVKGAMTPIMVVGALIALFTTKTGKTIQKIAKNVVDGAEQLTEAIPKVAKGLGNFIGESSHFIPFIGFIGIALLAVKLLKDR